LIYNVISFVTSIGKEYPFPKMPCILLVGALVASGDRLTPTEPVGETFPKPLIFLSLPTTPDRAILPKF
ncbi:MAG: hypothetical protein ACLR1T_06795, partial [Evtepia gabavorous]